MADQRRWGFAGLSDDEYDEFVGSGDAAQRAPAPVRLEARGALAARESSGSVMVSFDDQGDVCDVRLGRSWRTTAGGGQLGAVIATAANEELARSIRLPPQATGAPDLQPWNGSFRQLLDEAQSDILALSRAATAVQPQRTTHATSRTGVVRASVVAGAFAPLAIDPRWLDRSRDAAIEAELLDVLARLRRMTSPPELRHGPHGRAAAVLRALSQNPDALLRLAGVVR